MSLNQIVTTVKHGPAEEQRVASGANNSPEGLPSPGTYASQPNPRISLPVKLISPAKRSERAFKSSTANASSDDAAWLPGS